MGTRIDSDFGVINALLHHQMPIDGSDGLFRVVGVVHLFAASGIHLLALLVWVDGIMKAIGRVLQLPIRVVEPAIIFVFLGISFMAWKSEGFHFSLFRPLCSILIRKAMQKRGLEGSIFLPLFLTLFLEGLFCIRSGFTPGAIHYYFAVGGSLVALAKREARPSRLKTHLTMAIFSYIPIAVLDLVRDGIVAPFTPLLSLVSIPVLSLFLYPLLLFSSLTNGTPAPIVVSLVEGFMKALVLILDSIPLVYTVPMRAVWISGVIAFFFKFSWKPKLKWIPFLIFLIPIRLLLDMNELNRVIQIDVGQGDSALVQSPGRSEMIDVGSARSKKPEQWLRTLARFGVTQISGLLFTHLDEDHTGGAKALLSVISVGCIEMNSTHLGSVKGKKESAWLTEHFQRTPILQEGCIQSMKVAWFKSTRSSAKGNEIMAGVFREVGLGSGYFALGDGDQEQEALYEKRFQKEISSHSKRIWKVGHHGSRFSSDPDFLSRLHASEYWISVGNRNPYHHPAKDTLLRLQASCPRETCKMKRTDHLGDLVSNSVW